MDKVQVTTSTGLTTGANGAVAVDVVVPGKGGLCIVVESSGEYRVYRGHSSNPISFGKVVSRGFLEADYA